MASLIKNVKLLSLHWVPMYFNKLMRIHRTRLKYTCTSIGTCYRLIKDHRSNVSKSLMHKPLQWLMSNARKHPNNPSTSKNLGYKKQLPPMNPPIFFIST